MHVFKVVIIAMHHKKCGTALQHNHCQNMLMRKINIPDVSKPTSLKT